MVTESWDAASPGGGGGGGGTEELRGQGRGGLTITGPGGRAAEGIKDERGSCVAMRSGRRNANEAARRNSE